MTGYQGPNPKQITPGKPAKCEDDETEIVKHFTGYKFGQLNLVLNDDTKKYFTNVGPIFGSQYLLQRGLNCGFVSRSFLWMGNQWKWIRKLDLCTSISWIAQSKPNRKLWVLNYPGRFIRPPLFIGIQNREMWVRSEKKPFQKFKFVASRSNGASQNRRR
ncbi:MAG: hypothetical protein EZS28_031928 [Streblomastix strix]|uniref:Uncharacterized protein n=1 Tax=Streblomastix strix TaxID=222440 RepID=A0A5J4UPA6_9EUKA|nr:MAG: hypothetical protein EZS28_031928 [Streblomastix strix]